MIRNTFTLLVLAPLVIDAFQLHPHNPIRSQTAHDPNGGVGDATGPISLPSLFVLRTDYCILRKAISTTTQLQMAKRKPPNSGGNNNKKKKKSNSLKTINLNKKKQKMATKLNRRLEKDKNNKKGGGKDADITRASEKKGVLLPSANSRAPPWQVMSNKDMKQNANKLKQRRERLARGEDDIMEDDDDNGGGAVGISKSNRLLSDADRALFSWRRFNPISGGNNNGGGVGGMAFVGSYLDKRLPPSLGVPEVAFLGRSNVGKSSLLNKLVNLSCMGGGQSTGNKDEARVGKTPGATASVNLYALLGRNKKRQSTIAAVSSGTTSKPVLGFADLPGFGYAKLSKDIKEQVEIAAERYLSKRRELALGVLLVDARRIPSEDDRAVLAALYDMGVPLVIVATKVDKIAKNDFDTSMETIRDGLGLPPGQPLPVSSVSGEGVRDLWRIVIDACETRVSELRNEAEGKKEDDDEDDSGGNIQLDEDGNLIINEDEDDDVEYDQGYDWIRDGGGAVMYDDGMYPQNDDEDGEEQEEGEDDDEYMDESRSRMLENEQYQAAQRDSMKLKSLKRELRKMQRRGDVI